MATMKDIYVGVPEDDELVTVPDDWTVSQVLNEQDITTQGMIQLNGRTLNSNELGKTLSALGVANNDQIYVVKKLDSARL